MTEIARLELEGKTLELPVLTGSENEKGIDISSLRKESGYITLDPGYVNTGACTSAITFIDGEKGILKHRGYSIEDLANQSSFLEVSFLLIYGHLPSENELNTFSKRIEKYTELPEGISKVIHTFPKTAHPMSVLSACCAAMGGFYPDKIKQDLSTDEVDEVIAQLMAQLKVITAMFHRYTLSDETTSMDRGLGYMEGFCNMMFEKVDPTVAKAMDVLFILHADHEQNCSASSVRLVGSSKANLYSSISAGISALWGPWHGGANQRVIEMLEQIQASGGDYKKTLELVKEKKFRLFGFGHRVYKNFDPRARIIKKFCDEILATLGVNDPILNIAKGLEEAALSDDYFVQRKLYPNVDFYSGIIYKALNIPSTMFTPMFALGRLPGWIAQWKEMVEDSTMKIGRPRQIYTGELAREYQPISQR